MKINFDIDKKTKVDFLGKEIEPEIVITTDENLLIEIFGEKEDLIAFADSIYKKVKEEYKVEEKTKAKKCNIINSRFSWILCVDNQEIPFQGEHNAEFFKEHYEKLGYEVKIRNQYN